ncbi:hypothetical protein [Bifidobacterium commune]|uniref:hypothetical protein n=1 Tax=Bifidobacterium commune TaxID=1505727 RepID=UPI000B8326DE|nr:hypothetical protein [Bifidobacterium commune]
MSVISQDCDRLGRRAAELMLEEVNTADSDSKTIVIPITFIARGSGGILPKRVVEGAEELVSQLVFCMKLRDFLSGIWAH